MAWKWLRLGVGTRGESPSDHCEELAAEVAALRKAMRRQALVLDQIGAALRERDEEHEETERQNLIEVAEAFFHFSHFLRRSIGWDAALEEALERVWVRIDLVLRGHGVEMIRGGSCSFDPERHQAIESRDYSGEVPRVVEVLQPGFAADGKILKPAKVIVATPVENLEEFNRSRVL